MTRTADAPTAAGDAAPSRPESHPASTGDRGRSGTSRRNDQLALIVVASAIVAIFGPAAPTGTSVADALYRAAIGGLVAYAGSHAARWTWVIIAAASLAVARDWWQVPAVVALLLAVQAAFQPRTSRRLGALVAGLSIQGLLHGSTFGFHAAPTLLAVASTVPVLVSGYHRSPRAVRRGARISMLAGGAAALVLTLPFLVSALMARGKVEAGVADVRAAFGVGQPAAADPASRLEDAAASIGQAHSMVSGPWTLGARLVPGLAQQQRALSHSSDVASDAADTTSQSLGESSEDALALRKGRIDLDQVRASSTAMAEMEEVLTASSARFADDRLASPWLISPVRTMVDDLHGTIRGAGGSYATGMERAAGAMPSLLGANGPRRYLVLVVDPRISRGLGGVARAYAHVTADGGRLELDDSGPMQDFAGGDAIELEAPADFVNRYGPYQPGDHLSDLTYSPDLGLVARALSQIDPTVTARQPLDGVVVMDTTVLTALAKAAGTTVDLPTGELGEANDAAVNEQFATGLVDTIEAVLSTTMPGPSALTSELRPALEKGQLALYSRHDDDQRYLRSVGLTSELAPRGARGDVFGVTLQSVDADGLDRFVERSTEITKTAATTGVVVTEARLTLRNRADRATRQWLTIYSPGDAVAGVVDGSYLPLRWEEEGAVRAISTFVDLEPGESKTIVFGLRTRMDLKAGYQLHLFDQTGLGHSSLKATVVAPSRMRPVDVDGAEVSNDSIEAAVEDGGHLDVSTRFAEKGSDR